MKKYRLIRRTTKNDKDQYAVQKYVFPFGWRLLPLAAAYYAWFDNIEDARYEFDILTGKRIRFDYFVIEER